MFANYNWIILLRVFGVFAQSISVLSASSANNLTDYEENLVVFVGVVLILIKYSVENLPQLHNQIH